NPISAVFVYGSKFLGFRGGLIIGFLVGVIVFGIFFVFSFWWITVAVSSNQRGNHGAVIGVWTHGRRAISFSGAGCVISSGNLSGQILMRIVDTGINDTNGHVFTTRGLPRGGKSVVV